MYSLPHRTLTIATLLMLSLAAIAPDLLCNAAAAQAQSAPRVATASITGRVTSGTEPVAGVTIELRTSPSPFSAQRNLAVARTKTDEEGRFRLSNIAAGRYYIVPVAPTFVLPNKNQPGGMARTVVLDEGDALEGIVFNMIRGAVITGRVTDTEGRPVISETVRLESLSEQGDRQSGYYFNYSERFRTDDRGVYRIYGLAAGRYRVSIGSSRDENDGSSIFRGRRPYVRTFHPNTTEPAEAKIIELSPGSEATGVNITVGSLSEAFKADGRIVDADSGQPLPGLRFSYGNTDREQKHVAAVGAGDRSNHRGEFHLDNLAPGHYAVFLMPDGETDLTAEPTLFDVVDGDVAGLEIKVRRGASLSGTVTVEGTSDRNIMEKVRRLQIYIGVERKGLQFPSGNVPKLAPDGSFLQLGLPPGRAHINIWPPNSEGLSVLRVERDGVTLNNGIELEAGQQVTGVRIVLVYGTGVVRGRIITPSGLIPEGMRLNIGVRRTDSPQMRVGMQPVEVDERGRFLIEGLPSGEYEITMRAMPRQVVEGDRSAIIPRPPRPATQRVSVTNGTQTEVSFTLNTDAEEPGGEG